MVRITVLKDNRAARPAASPGHGLALLVETPDRRVLLDTGPDDTVVANAQALRIPLAPLDAVVLSHGHYDHTGGLEAVLGVTGPVKVVGHPAIFDRTFSGSQTGGLRDLGMRRSRAEYEAAGACFELTEMPYRLGETLLTSGHVPPLHLEPRQRAGLWRERDGSLRADDFRDDCSLVVQLGESAAVLTGCAHPGLGNVLCKVQTLEPQRPLHTLVGGLHLGAATEKEVSQLARELAEWGVKTVLPCHCTGEAAMRVLRDRFVGKVIAVGAGSVITLHDDGKAEVRYPLPLT